MFNELEEQLAEINAKLNLLATKFDAVAPKQWPRWMSMETAGQYINKSYGGMRSTVKVFPGDFPVAYIGDKPRIDKNDIDKFFLNGKGKK